MPAEVIDLDQEFHLGNSFTLETAERLGILLSDEYRIIVKYDRPKQLPHYGDDKLNIVISTSRETHDVPNEFFRDDVFLIFQHYFMLDPWGYPIDNPLVYPMPHGPFRDLNLKSIKPIPERKYDFSFVGQIPDTGTRDSFKRNLDKVIETTGDKFNFFVKYTDGFSKGLSPEEYLDLLNDSKISLCPQGANSDETFRFFESIMMGSIPLVETLPRFWFYETAPHFKNKWRDLDRTLSLMLNFLQTPDCRPVLSGLADYCNLTLCPHNLANHLKEQVLFRRNTKAANHPTLDELRKNLMHIQQTANYLSQ